MKASVVLQRYAAGERNFQRVNLRGQSFKGKNLSGADFSGGDSYLQTTQVQQWLIGLGKDKNFDGQKLQGINLQGADLTDVSFIDANLNKANLQDADLSRAKLVQTQLDRTDFTGATLTGAFIEDWGITTHTKLDQVKCKYVFMRLPTEKDPEPCRKPDNRSEVFEDGDFTDFIQPIFDTLDLYHNQGVDPRAIAISWKELAENNPDAKLQFASMEVKGKDNLLLRLKTLPNSDLSKLSADYFETYNQIKALAEAESKILIAEKDDRIQQLANMVNTALQSPSLSGDYVAGNKTDQSRNLNNSGEINNSGAGAFNSGNINDTVANTINQIPKSSNP